MRAIVFCAVIALCSAEAFGHARLTTSEPVDGGVLDATADAVTLCFSEAIQPAFSDFALHYLGSNRDAAPAAGNRLPRARPVLDDARRCVEIPLPEPLEPGWYALDWQVLSVDGHTTGGIERFHAAP
jgi:copper resistance protein C